MSEVKPAPYRALSPEDADLYYWRAWAAVLAREKGEVHSVMHTFDTLVADMEPRKAARRALAKWGVPEGTVPR